MMLLGVYFSRDPPSRKGAAFWPRLPRDVWQRKPWRICPDFVSPINLRSLKLSSWINPLNSRILGILEAFPIPIHSMPPKSCYPHRTQLVRKLCFCSKMCHGSILATSFLVYLYRIFYLPSKYNSSSCKKGFLCNSWSEPYERETNRDPYCFFFEHIFFFSSLVYIRSCYVSNIVLYILTRSLLSRG